MSFGRQENQDDSHDEDSQVEGRLEDVSGNSAGTLDEVVESVNSEGTDSGSSNG